MELVLTRIAKKKKYTIGRMDIRTENTEKTEDTEKTPSVTAVPSVDSVAAVPSVGSVASVPSENSVRICDALEPPVLAMKTHLDTQTVLRSPMKTQALKPFAIPEGRYAVATSSPDRLPVSQAPTSPTCATKPLLSPRAATRKPFSDKTLTTPSTAS